MLTGGTGVETRSLQQVSIMRDFNATVIIGFGDYIKRLSEVARENGIEPGKDIRIRVITGHMGAESRETMSAAWGGAQVYDWYGVGDTGTIASEATDQSGMYVHEDAQYLELLDGETGAPVAEGAAGDMVVTCLYKDDLFPIIRFNTHDVTQFVTTPSPLGLTFRRIVGFLGRSDNMVKLRGINIYPTGIGAMLTEAFDDLLSEYVCICHRQDGRDEMLVQIEATGDLGRDVSAYEALLKTRLGVEIGIHLVARGALADLTQIETRQKPIRLIDRRDVA
jgi:phenylacetate-CoA ligase